MSEAKPAHARYLLVLDFEATCEQDNKKWKNEIIEFPVVLLDLRSPDIAVVDEFREFVRPSERPVLTKFCTDLTSITQDQVSKAGTLGEVLPKFEQWARGHGLLEGGALAVTCGDWDLDRCLPAECKRKGLAVPGVLRSWCNIKAIFGELHGGKRQGMDGMLKALRLPLVGRHHLGSDDARNIATIARTLARSHGPTVLRPTSIRSQRGSQGVPAPLDGAASASAPSAAAAPGGGQAGRRREEKRRHPEDGLWYTEAEFLEYHRQVGGDGRALWDAARPASEGEGEGERGSGGAGGVRPTLHGEWAALLAQDPGPCVRTVEVPGEAGRRPAPEHVAAVQRFRQTRRAFLAACSPEERAAIQNPQHPQPRGPGGGGEGGSGRQQAGEDEMLLALRRFAIPGPARLVDIGANLQTRYSQAQIERQLVRAAAAGVERVVLTGCDLKGSRKGCQVAEWWARRRTQLPGHPPKVYFTAGVHPHDAAKVWRGGAVEAPALAELEALAAHPLCVSLGEAGLDYDRMFSPRDCQLAVFEAQVALAGRLGRALFTHVRERGPDKGAPLGVYDDAMAILERYPEVPPDRVCVHCFTGNASELGQVVGRGLCVGLTGFVGMERRASASGTLAALAAPAALPPRRLMIETDAPFMLPDRRWLPADIGVGKGKCEPAVMPAVCRAVAQAVGLTPEVVAETTTANANAFFQFDRSDAAWLGSA